jgi:AcrR family transcriptional regulator
MPQVLKEEVRTKITDAALAVFARDGFEAATMAGIAHEAGMGAASIYRYYTSKDDLFAAVITPALTNQFDSLLERRVGALARTTLRGETIDDLGDEMLQFWLANRLAVVILLDRAPQEPYGERFVELLVKHTLAELRADGTPVSPRAKLVLTTIFDNTRRLLARVLAEYSDPAELREAIEIFWSYQIAGLRGLRACLAGDRDTASAAVSRAPRTPRR